MSPENETGGEHNPESVPRQYPFGLSSRQLFVFVILVGLIGPGLVVYVLEQANLSLVANIVWIGGYGTTVFVVWFIWIRPLDLVGTTAQDSSITDETAPSKAEASERGGEGSRPTEAVETFDQGDASQETKIIDPDPPRSETSDSD